MLLPIFFPQKVLPKGDRISFVQEEPLILQLRLMALVFDWVAALFILVGIPFQVTSAIWQLPTRVLARIRVSAWLVSPDIHCFTSADVLDFGSPKAQLFVPTYGSAWQVLRASDGKDLRGTHVNGSSVTSHQSNTTPHLVFLSFLFVPSVCEIYIFSSLVMSLCA